MKVFRCDHCQHLVFFENILCVKCQHLLAFLPDLGVVGSLQSTAEGTYTSPLRRAPSIGYRLCSNYTGENVCNWAVSATDPNPLCLACRLTRAIPDLSVPGHREAWYKLEVAKRRLVYSLLKLQLPLANRIIDPDRGLTFDFLVDPPDATSPQVLTGHIQGVITINLSEADDSERERRRVQLHEPYRTVLGHFRHESGHYYWDRLIADSYQLESFRETFGDEQADYGEALARHHTVGPPVDWSERCVSAYASAHPWEDWAETWAHYLHIVDALETAAGCGLLMRPRRAGDPAIRHVPDPVDETAVSFDELLDSWLPLTYMLNNLNRGLGLLDSYPFVLAGPVIEKLRFVHDLVQAHRAESKAEEATRPTDSPFTAIVQSIR